MYAFSFIQLEDGTSNFQMLFIKYNTTLDKLKNMSYIKRSFSFQFNETVLKNSAVDIDLREIENSYQSVSGIVIKKYKLFCYFYKLCIGALDICEIIVKGKGYRA